MHYELTCASQPAAEIELGMSTAGSIPRRHLSGLWSQGMSGINAPKMFVKPLLVVVGCGSDS